MLSTHCIRGSLRVAPRFDSKDSVRVGDRFGERSLRDHPEPFVDATMDHPTPGLHRNIRLFAILVLINGFVGLMVGIERTLVPLLGSEVFALASKVAIVSFIATFGITKAFANLLAGTWSQVWGRRPVLLLGWVVGIPVPILLMLAPPPHWWIVLVANVLLGVNQGFCWSTMVVMKVDIVGETRRGLAMGLNEFAGYSAVGGAAFLTGYLASAYGIRPVPFLLGVVAAVVGLILSVGFARETLAFTHAAGDRPARPPPGWFAATLRRYTAPDRTLASINQAGLVNNLNDGVAWGLLPLLFLRLLPNDITSLGILVAIYPTSWGILQLATGPLSDTIGRKVLIAGGMVLQGGALVLIAVVQSLPVWSAGMLLFGLGTAMVYPTLLSAVGDVLPPGERSPALGVYRFWRDLGFAIGALGGGVIADLADLDMAIIVTGVVTILSGLVAAALLRETRVVAQPVHGP